MKLVGSALHSLILIVHDELRHLGSVMRRMSLIQLIVSLSQKVGEGDVLSNKVHEPSKSVRSAATEQWIGINVRFALSISLFLDIDRMDLLDESDDRSDNGIICHTQIRGEHRYSGFQIPKPQIDIHSNFPLCFLFIIR